MPLPSVTPVSSASPAQAVDAILGFEVMSGSAFASIFVRLVIAAILGAIIAYRCWRGLIPRTMRTLPPARETAQAQVLIAVAGALMVAVIGDSTARAFGLVGLGAFIRFRSGIKDPRDAAVMFVMIGIGMACGLGAVPMAIVATVFVGAVLTVFDAGSRSRMRRTRVGILVDDPRGAYAGIRAAFPDARMLECPNTNPQAGKVVMEVAIEEDADAAALLGRLEEQNVSGIRSVTLEEGKSV